MIEVERIDELEVAGPARLVGADQMSPYVWPNFAGDGFLLLARIVENNDGPAKSGSIWLGRAGLDGLRFRMDAEPLLTPGPAWFDTAGCEDPTMVPTPTGCLVYYTGVDARRAVRLLCADGPDLRHLTKRGVAHATGLGEKMTKEAAVECVSPGEWRLFFEYALDGRSRVGLAMGTDPRGPWREIGDPFMARPGCWDEWHLSTGPLLRRELGEGRRLMFYNGADETARWGIGWVILGGPALREVARSNEPLLIGELDAWGGVRGIAFAASLVPRDERAWLYFTHDDRRMFRATLRIEIDRLISSG